MLRLLSPLRLASSTLCTPASLHRSLSIAATHRRPFSTAAPPTTLSREEATEATIDALLRHPYPIVLDCFAEWCDPCKVLAPRLIRRLESASIPRPQSQSQSQSHSQSQSQSQSPSSPNQSRTIALAQRIRFATLDVDKHPQLAAALRVSSLPTVFALHRARIIANFTGNVSDADLDAFVNKVASHPSLLDDSHLHQLQQQQDQQDSHEHNQVQDHETEQTVASDVLLQGADQHMGGGRIQDAILVYQTVAERKESGHQIRALVGLLRCALSVRNVDAVNQISDVIKNQHAKEAGTPSVSAALKTVELTNMGIIPFTQIRTGNEISTDVVNAQGKPAPELLFESAVENLLSLRYESAVDDAVLLIRLHRQWNDQAARKVAQAVLESIPPRTPNLTGMRKRISSMLFA